MGDDVVIIDGQADQIQIKQEALIEAYFHFLFVNMNDLPFLCQKFFDCFKWGKVFRPVKHSSATTTFCYLFSQF